MSYVCTVNLHKHTAGHIQALQVDHVEAEFCISSKKQALCIKRGQRLELQLQAVMLLPHGHLMCLGTLLSQWSCFLQNSAICAATYNHENSAV